jgi:biotin transporter BioY
MVTVDGLLLGLRIVAVIKFDASTLENLFFVVKNILTIAIFTYYAAAISDSYIRHRYRYQQYVRNIIQQVSQELVLETKK